MHCQISYMHFLDQRCTVILYKPSSFIQPSSYYTNSFQLYMGHLQVFYRWKMQMSDLKRSFYIYGLLYHCLFCLYRLYRNSLGDIQTKYRVPNIVVHFIHRDVSVETGLNFLKVLYLKPVFGGFWQFQTISKIHKRSLRTNLPISVSVCQHLLWKEKSVGAQKSNMAKTKSRF